MVRIVVIALLIVAGTLTGMAQSTAKSKDKGKPAPKANTETVKAKQTPEQKAKATLDKMKTACALKPEQEAKVESAWLDYYKKHDALKKQKDVLSKNVYDDREDALKKTRNTTLKSTLTAAQYKQWQAAKDKEKGKEEPKKKDSDEE